jgi:OOP family OmpA-OmpF porin
MPEADPDASISRDQAEDKNAAFEQARVQPDEIASGADAIPAAPSDNELVLLRSLLMQREMAQLERIMTRLGNPADHARYVSEVIAEALLLRSSAHDEKLNKALELPVETVLRLFLHKKPQDVVGILFPVIGATIRRSIAESFHAMLGSLNRSLELSFSLNGLRWRMEALRTGKSFSEVVLLHTLLYHVEQVFLIHSETGLVLAHVVDEGAPSQDADMVSAMLTAIQDFAHDCFADGQDGQLESLRMGDFTIMLESAPQAYIACVVRGTPPSDLPERIAANLELVIAECEDELSNFKGDTSPFQKILRYLQDCLISKSAEESRPVPLWLRIIPIALAFVLLLGPVIYFWHGSHARQAEQQRIAAHHARMEQGLNVLRDEPGYVVLEAIRPPGVEAWSIIILRDNLARTPEEVLAETNYTPTDYKLRLTPYMSFHPRLLERRIIQKIHPPPTVEANVDDDGILRLSGEAPLGWILQARQTAIDQPGINDVDLRGIRDPRYQRLTALLSAIEETTILFPMGKATPAPEDEERLIKTIDNLAELERLAKSMGMYASLTVYGHADAVGNDKRNYELSQERAKMLAVMLYARGSSMPISLYGMGADHADKSKVFGEGDQYSRKIEFRVHLGQAIEADFEILKGQYE